MSEPTNDGLKDIGQRVLGRGLEYDRGELRLAQEIACKDAEIERLRAEVERLKTEIGKLESECEFCMFGSYHDAGRKR